ncbi:MAG: glycosyltransferase family 4 protein [Chloroflexi bacterium]|nr:glycosyltransferase family 4 protein [Chloroflexota bacterium]
MTRALRIAQVAPPMERVPPRAYGGTERIVHELAAELDRRGHEVTTFASGDSEVAGRLIPTVPNALRPAGYDGDAAPWFYLTIQAVLDRAAEFDIIHSHLEWASCLLSRVSPVPVVSTFHGRIDLPWAAESLANAGGALVAISANQASTNPDVAWAGVVHNGLTLDGAPFERRRGDGLCFVGRVAPEKGIIEAIEIAKATGRTLRIAAKSGPAPAERDYLENVFRPALRAAGTAVEYLGEVEQAERDELFAGSCAALMPGSWPEPFGLVAIEALATGTPVIARRVGALPEIIRDGIDGFFGDDIDQLAYQVGRIDTLDRMAIRQSVLVRFSAARMTDGYEAVYRRTLEPAGDESGGPTSVRSGTSGIRHLTALEVPA